MLPGRERKKALFYGIIGAYIFRGFALAFVALLVNIWWLRPIGGGYLIFLFVKWLRARNKHEVEQEKPPVENAYLVKLFGKFWTTVIMVEVMDISFSIDNVFAAVAFSKNIVLVAAGVVIGILAMRFVAQAFVKLMDKYPFLEGSAYCVIGFLGIKLLMSLLQHFYPTSQIALLLESNLVDYGTSAITILIFLCPIVYYKLRKEKSSL